MAQAELKFDQKAFEAGLSKAIATLKLTSESDVGELGYSARNFAVVNTPVDTGRARSAWYVQHGVDERGPYADVGNSVSYIWTIEYGSRPHVIEVKNAKVLANKRTGQVFGKRVNHPGTKAQAPLRRGLLQAVSTHRWNIHG